MDWRSQNQPITTWPKASRKTVAFAERSAARSVCRASLVVRRLHAQAYFLLEEGALPQQVDSAMERWGMAMGPLRTMDLAGQDIGWNIRKRRATEQPDRPYSRIPDLICERGWFGQKTRRGYYIYGERGAKPAVDPEVEAIVLEESARLGITRREISSEEIVERCLFALVNEGAKLLAEVIAASARRRHSLDERLRFPEIPRWPDVLC